MELCFVSPTHRDGRAPLIHTQHGFAFAPSPAQLSVSLTSDRAGGLERVSGRIPSVRMVGSTAWGPPRAAGSGAGRSPCPPTAPSSPGNGRPDPQGFDLDLNRALLRPATSASVVLTLPWGPPGIWGPGAPVRSSSLVWTPAGKPGGLSAGGGLRPPEVVNLRTGGKRALGQGTAGSGSAGAQGGAQGVGSRAGCSPGALTE